MMTPRGQAGSKLRGRRGVLAAGCLAGATLAAMAPVVWRRVEEELCLRRLDSVERTQAIERLGELRSARAVPRLVELALADGMDSWSPRRSTAAQALLAIGRPAVKPLLALVPDDTSGWGRAREILCEFGAEAVPPFVEAARDPDAGVRSFALDRLGRFVNTDRAVFDCLVKGLADPAEGVRSSAVGGLAGATSRAREVAPLLAARLEDPAESSSVRYFAAMGLPVLGQAGVQSLRALLTHTDALVRVYAAHGLQNADPRLEQEMLPVLLAALRVEHSDARCHALSMLSSTTHLSVAALASFLKDPSAEVQSQALSELWRRRTAPASALPDLLRILRAGPPPGWGSVVDLLGELGPAAGEAVPDLVKVLEEGKAEAQYCAISALMRIGQVPKSLVPALIRALSVELTCDVAAMALGWMGPDAAEAVPALIAALGSHGVHSSRASVEALGRIGVPAVSTVLAALRQAPDENIYWTLRAVAALGPLSREATPHLVEIVRQVEEDSNPVELAVRALGRIGPGASEAVPLLVGLIKSDYVEETDALAAAPEALGRLGPGARSAAAVLLEESRSSRADRRAAAVLALGRLRVEGEAVLVAARRALEDDEPIVRSCAALALNHLGADGTEVQKRLGVALKDPVSGLQLLNAMEGYPGELKAALPALLIVLGDEVQLLWYELNSKACDLIGELGRDGAPAIPVLEGLIERLRLRDAGERSLNICSSDRAAAERALRRIREALKSPVPTEAR